MWWLLACAAPPAGDTASVPTEGELSVLSYNVHGLPEAITGDDTTARQELIAPHLDAYDLVGVQEDWIDENHSVLDAACTHSSRLRWNEPLDESRVYGAGLSIWVRGETAAREDVGWFDTCYGTFDDASDCLASKGWAMLRVTLGASSLDFYTLHFEAGSGEGDDPARAAQVDIIVELLETTSAGRAVLLVGDTNLADGDPEDDVELAKLRGEAGLSDACDVVGCPEPGRIDRVLVRDGEDLALEVTGWEVAPEFVDALGEPLSDHDPIHVSLRWSTR